MSLDPIGWNPTVPQIAGTTLASLKLDGAEVKSGQSAARLPQWFEDVTSALESLIKEVSLIGDPTRVSMIGPSQLGGNGDLTYRYYSLPEDSSSPVELEVSPKTTGIPGAQSQPFTWWASEGDTVLRIVPKDRINTLIVGSFGESLLKVETENYSSRWLSCSWERKLYFPTTRQPLTIHVQGNAEISGISNLAGLRTTFSLSASVTLGTISDSDVTVEQLPEGSAVKIEYAETTSGPWFETDNYPLTETAVTLASVDSNLSATLAFSITEGSNLWMGEGAWLFESYIGKVIVDDDPSPNHASGNPQSWRGIDSRIIRRGIRKFTDAGGELVSFAKVPQGFTWRISAQVMCLRGSEQNYTMTVSEGNKVSLFVNDSHVSATKDGTYNLRLRTGINTIAFYGRRTSADGLLSVRLGTGTYTFDPARDSAFRGLHWIHHWYASILPVGEKWPPVSWAQDAGLSYPYASQRDGVLRTSVIGADCGEITLPWRGTGAMTIIGHDASVASVCLLRSPRYKKKVARGLLTGGPDQTPIVRVSYKGAP